MIHEDDASMLSRPESNLSAFVGGNIELAPAEKLLKDGDVVRAGSLSVKVIHTPGHTRGSVCFLVDEEGGNPVLFSGDTLFAGSIGRTDLPGGDEGTLLASLEKLARLPHATRVLPGHGPETTLGEERRRNPFWPEEYR
jgi:glyoxylase-like metal-dependent hydrolase (beta-lactamase superfamily II)